MYSGGSPSVTWPWVSEMRETVIVSVKEFLKSVVDLTLDEVL